MSKQWIKIGNKIINLDNVICVDKNANGIVTVHLTGPAPNTDYHYCHLNAEETADAWLLFESLAAEGN